MSTVLCPRCGMELGARLEKHLQICRTLPKPAELAQEYKDNKDLGVNILAERYGVIAAHITNRLLLAGLTREYIRERGISLVCNNPDLPGPAILAEEYKSDDDLTLKALASRFQASAARIRKHLLAAGVTSEFIHKRGVSVRIRIKNGDLIIEKPDEPQCNEPQCENCQAILSRVPKGNDRLCGWCLEEAITSPALQGAAA